MAGPPPPWAWRAETGYLPPAHLWLPGDIVATPVGGAIYGPAPNPNVFFDMGDGPPGPIVPMQFGVTVSPIPPLIPVQPAPMLAAPVVATPVQTIPVMCPTHHCACDHCGCYRSGPVHQNWHPGFNVLPPAETIRIHVHWDTTAQWSDNVTSAVANKSHLFIIDMAWSVNYLIKTLILARKKALPGGPDDPDGWALTEFTEKGGGSFSKGSMFKHGEDKAKKTLDAIGWTTRRGQEGHPPIMCQLHKAPA